MRGLWGLLIIGIALVLGGCGGGGGAAPGGTVAVTGTVLWLSTAAPPNPAATIQVGSRSVRTSDADGSFLIDVAPGTTSLLVVVTTPGGATITSRFDFPAATATTALGDLWVGPTTTAVQGRILNSADDTPIVGSRVSFAGRQTVTGGDGRFSLAGVAYDPTDVGLSVFTALEGQAAADGFFPRAFRPESAAVGGVVELDDIRLAPDTGSSPPPLPYTIEGTVSPDGATAGAQVLVRQAGTTVRLATVDPTRRYAVWVPAGTYTLSARNGAGAEGTPVTVTVTSPTLPIRQNLSLP